MMTQPINAIPLALLAINSVVFGVAIRSFFLNDGFVPPKMKVLAVVGALSSISHGFAIWTTSANLVVISFSSIVYIISLAIFASVLSTTGPRNLPIAFLSHNPNNIFQHGPFKLTRHPCYLSYSLTWIAGVIIYPGYITVVPASILIIVYFFLAHTEEKAILKSDKSDEYIKYKSLVGILGPRWRSKNRTANRGIT